MGFSASISNSRVPANFSSFFGSGFVSSLMDGAERGFLFDYRGVVWAPERFGFRLGFGFGLRFRLRLRLRFGFGLGSGFRLFNGGYFHRRLLRRRRSRFNLRRFGQNHSRHHKLGFLRYRLGALVFGNRGLHLQLRFCLIYLRRDRLGGRRGFKRYFRLFGRDRFA
jgi:hypothetical protein